MLGAGSNIDYPYIKGRFSLYIYIYILIPPWWQSSEGINSPAAAGAPHPPLAHRTVPGAIPYTSIYLYVRPYASIYFHIPSYTSIYLNILSYTSNILSYTSIYHHVLPYSPTYLQISNVRNMRANMSPKNDHISSPRPFPRVRIGHNACQCVSMDPTHPKEIKQKLK